MSMPLLSYFLPSADQAIGFLSLAGILVGFAIIGAACTGSRRVSGADIFAGWGAVIFVFVIAGVFTSINFSALVYSFFASAGLLGWFVYQRDRRQGLIIANLGSMWKIFALAAPFLLLVTAMRASQWDEFSHWLPNAQFLFQHNAFPHSDLPKSPSALPAYPYGLPLVTYLASKIAGHFVENTSAIFNLILLFCHAGVLAHIIPSALGEDSGKEKAIANRWSMLALCMLGVTILSTTFVQKIVLTSYADSTTSVTLAVIAVLMWKILNKLAVTPQSDEINAESHALAWQCGLVITAFIFLKQTNLVLLVLLFTGFLIVVLRDPALRLIDFFWLAPKLLLPGIVVYLAWRFHVGQHLSYGEVSLLPFEHWLINDAFLILGKMTTIAAKKASFFVVMIILSIFSIRGIFKSIGPTERLLIPIAVVFIGFNFFLWLMYVTVFGKGEGLRAASFWRYNIQLGLLGVTGAAYGLALLWRRYVSDALTARPALAKALISLPIIIVLILPITFPHKLRFDIRPQKDHMRLVGQELAKLLPNNTALALMDLNSNGFTAKVIRYELTSGSQANKKISIPINFRLHHDIKKPSQLMAYLSKHPVTYIWIHQPLPVIDKALSVKLEPYASHLLKRNKSKWDLIKSWPYAGYKDPHSLPD